MGQNFVLCNIDVVFHPKMLSGYLKSHSPILKAKFGMLVLESTCLPHLGEMYNKYSLLVYRSPENYVLGIHESNVVLCSTRLSDWKLNQNCVCGRGPNKWNEF